MYFFYYMPVGIDVQRRRTPIMTVFFAVLCTVFFFLNRYASGAGGADFSNYVYYPGYSTWGSALAAIFMHFGYMHLIGNLVYLLLFGWYLEDRMGSVQFAALYLLAGYIGNVTQGWYNIHVLNLQFMGIIGASGAVSGVLGAFLVRFPISRIKIAYWIFMPLQAYTRAGRVHVPVVAALAIWVLMQVTRGLTQLEGASTSVAHLTHVSGFATGVGWAAATGQWASGRVEGHWIKAKRYLDRGEFYAAQDELTRYVSRRPSDGEAYAALARVQIQTGDPPAARFSYRRGCELMLAAGERGASEDLYKEATRGFPDFSLSAAPHLDLAYGLERNLKFIEALKAYENFGTRYPDHEDAAFTLLRVANLEWKTFSRPDQARVCYQRLIEDYPHDAWADFAREQVRILG